MERVYSYNPGARTGLGSVENRSKDYLVGSRRNSIQLVHLLNQVRVIVVSTALLQLFHVHLDASEIQQQQQQLSISV